MNFLKGNLQNGIIIFLGQMIVYLGVWIWDDYIAKFLTILMVMVSSGVLVISLIAELIERSKVPGIYFVFMVVSILTPVIAAVLVLATGAADWTFDQPLIRN